MFGLSFSELFIVATLLIPLGLLMLGIAVLTGYIVYLIVRDSVKGGFHLLHKKAH